MVRVSCKIVRAPLELNPQNSVPIGFCALQSYHWKKSKENSSYLENKAEFSKVPNKIK